jgi:hypothetical protein
LVNGQGQTIRSAAAQGAIVTFEETPGYCYVAGDATAAYMGKLNKWVRHILFLRPGLFLLLDEVVAPTPSRFQWMFHAFEEMQIGERKITSRRAGATLDVYLAGSQDLTLTQTDWFDTPYNHGIPEAYHRQKANHWHVTAETAGTSQTVRIAAVMAVYGADERCEVRVQTMSGWFGATAAGGFGRVEGWIRVGDGDTLPTGFAVEQTRSRIGLCGRDRHGKAWVK